MKRIMSFEQWQQEKQRRSKMWRLIAAILIVISILICLAGCSRHDGYLDTGPVLIDESVSPMDWTLPRYPQTYDQSFWEAD